MKKVTSAGRVIATSASRTSDAHIAGYGFIAGAGATTVTLLAPGIALGGAISVAVGLGLLAGVLYLIDLVELGLSKVDDLDRVGGHLNGILDLCMESREKYYEKSSHQQLAQFSKRKVANLEGSGLKKFQAFQELWSVGHSSQGQNIAESSQIACNELVQEEGLERLRNKGIAVPGDTTSSGERARGVRALNSLCRAYEGIVRCYSSMSSPYGERGRTKESAISNKRAIKEQGGYLWDFYQSLGGGSSVLE